MSRVASAKSARTVDQQDAPSARVWGLSVRDAHDRRWAARSVMVVRCGDAKPVERGPRLYLLMGKDDLASFPLPRLLRRMQWINPSAMRVRITPRDGAVYAERVVTDDEGNLLTVKRDYSASAGSAGRVVLTTKAAVANAWREAPDPRSAWRRIREKWGRDSTLVGTERGAVSHLSSPIEAMQFAATLLENWSTVGATLDGVYEFAPGVWFHETSLVHDGVRFSPPVWVGAGIQLDADASVVGPGVLPDAHDAHVEPSPIDWVEQKTSPLRRAPIRGLRRRRVSKRLFDIAFAILVLTMTLPLYPIVMLLIYIEDGRPFFFAHYRQTLRGREFPCYKFRTMIKDAEGLKAQLAAANQADGPQFFIEKDPRLLRIGALLRRFQIDELPQFWNVLLGHMSVVGPRPSPDKENQYCPAWREARLSVRPGVTGLWQVRRTREPETDFQEWIRYDLEYVQHQSWRLDIWIILQTVKQVLGG